MPIRQIEEDYVAPETTYATFIDRDYEVVGIEFFTLDDDGSPRFIAQDGTRLVARYRTLFADGEQGPPGNVNRGQLAPFVKAFGADPTELPPYNQAQNRLIVAERIINASEKIVVVTVKNGWVRFVHGDHVKPGHYRLKYSSIASTNQLGEMSWREGKWGPWILVEMEIVSDGVGRPSIYDHVRTIDFMNYSLKFEEGDLNWEVTEDGAWTAGSARMNNFFRAVCGQAFFEMAGNNEFDDMANIMPEVHQLASQNSRAGAIFLASIGLDKKGRQIVDLSALEPINGQSEEVSISFGDEDMLPREEELEGLGVDRLYDRIAELYTDGKAFGSTGKMNPKAKVWWREFVGIDPVDNKEVVGIMAYCTKYEIPPGFKSLTPSHVDKILDWMNNPLVVEEIDDEEDF